MTYIHQGVPYPSLEQLVDHISEEQDAEEEVSFWPTWVL